MSAAACVSVLLGAPPLPLESTVPSDVAIRTVQRVLHKQAKYWSSLRPQFLDPRTYYNDEDVATRPAAGGRPEGTFKPAAASIRCSVLRLTGLC